MTVTRGTTNANQRGGVKDRARRRAFLLNTYASDVTGFTRCYRCGVLMGERELTVDRIVPGAQGGTYRRENVRPACGPCNSITGGAVRRK